MHSLLIGLELLIIGFTSCQVRETIPPERVFYEEGIEVEKESVKDKSMD